jgi:hypothetical protein
MMDVDGENNKRKQAPCRDPPHVKRPSRDLGEISYLDMVLNHPKAYAAWDQEKRKELRDCVINNRANFCKICGLNLKFCDHLSAAYQAIVISPLDGCNICASTKDKICDVYAHKCYHRNNCLTK